MTAKLILAIKGSDVATIPGNATLLLAAQQMTELKIGSVVITGAGRRVLGIFTERDLLRAVARKSDKALHQLVSEYMTKDVVTRPLNTSVNDLEELTSGRKFRHVPIVDEKFALCGIISSGDITKYKLDQSEREAAAAKDYIRTA